MAGRLAQLLHFLTIQQWAKIDEEHKTESTSDPRLVWIFVAIAICLILPRYFGHRSFLAEIPGARSVYETWPHPELYPRLYWAAFKTINYILVPVLIIKVVLNGRVRDFGFRASKNARVKLLYLAMLLCVMPLVFGVSFSDAFSATYPKYKGAGDSWFELIAWESAYAYQFFALEFFFRGFVVFALARYLGHVAVFVMVVPYAMIHFSKPLPETLGSIIAGTALGTLSLRTGSIYGGVVLHVAVGWSMDLFALGHDGRLWALLGLR